MVAYNFKARFVDPIETRFKRQTIRPNRKRNPRLGEALQLYTGMRTRHCRKLWTPDPTCIGITPIKIDRGSVELNGQPLTVEQQTELAIADGFRSLEEFQEFFYGADSMSPGYQLPFEGVLIQWDELPFKQGQEVTLRENGWISEGSTATFCYPLPDDLLVVELNEPIPHLVQPAFKHLNLSPGHIVVKITDVKKNGPHS